MADVIALVVEIVGQKCAEQEELERQAQDEKIKEEIGDLRQEVSALKDQLKRQEKLLNSILGLQSSPAGEVGSSPE